jgi:hypothetical protein
MMEKPEVKTSTYHPFKTEEHPISHKKQVFAGGLTELTSDIVFAHPHPKTWGGQNICDLNVAERHVTQT